MAARSGLNISYLMVWMTLRLLCMAAQIIQTMSFTQIMDIWRPGSSVEDHLKRQLSTCAPRHTAKHLRLVMGLDALCWNRQNRAPTSSYSVIRALIDGRSDRQIDRWTIQNL